MRWRLWLAVVGVLLARAASGQERDLLPLLAQAAEPKKDKDKPAPKPPDVAQLPPLRDEIRPTLNPPMIGDFPGSWVLGQYAVTTFTDIDGTRFATVTDIYRLRLGQFARGSFKIAENESPRPTDRLYAGYSYFSGLRTDVVNGGSIATPLVQDPSTQAIVRLNPIASPTTLTRGAFDGNLHRTTLGFEKTFLNGDASLGLRVPLLGFNQSTQLDLSGPNAARYLGVTAVDAAPQVVGVGYPFDDSSIGDLSVVLKFAPINDIDVLSFGMVVTVPTGDGVIGPFGYAPHSTLLQPYLGYIRDFDRFFVHGFSSIVIPTDGREPTLLFNDIGLCWRLRENPGGFLAGIIPTLEAHLTTPLNHRDPAGYTSASDLLVLTAGVHFLLGERTTLTFGLGTPVTGPRCFESESTVLLNFRF